MLLSARIWKRKSQTFDLFQVRNVKNISKLGIISNIFYQFWILKSSHVLESWKFHYVLNIEFNRKLPESCMKYQEIRSLRIFFSKSWILISFLYVAVYSLLNRQCLNHPDKFWNLLQKLFSIFWRFQNIHRFYLRPVSGIPLKFAA